MAVKLAKLCKECGERGEPSRPVEAEFNAEGRQTALKHRDC